MSRCQQCDREFSCGMVDAVAATPCWCTLLPATEPATEPDSAGIARCYCPDCLRLRIAAATGEGDKPFPQSA